MPTIPSLPTIAISVAEPSWVIATKEIMPLTGKKACGILSPNAYNTLPLVRDTICKLENRCGYCCRDKAARIRFPVGICEVLETDMGRASFEVWYGQSKKSELTRPRFGPMG